MPQWHIFINWEYELLPPHNVHYSRLAWSSPWIGPITCCYVATDLQLRDGLYCLPAFLVIDPTWGFDFLSKVCFKISKIYGLPGTSPLLGTLTVRLDPYCTLSQENKRSIFLPLPEFHLRSTWISAQRFSAAKLSFITYKACSS